MHLVPIQSAHQQEHQISSLYTPFTLSMRRSCVWQWLSEKHSFSFRSKGLSRIFYSTIVQKHQSFGVQTSLWSNSYPYMTTGKTIALTRWTFVGKVMSLLFNMLFRFVIAFLSRRKCLLISWLQSPSAVIFFPIYLQWSDGTRCHDFSFLNVKF